MRPYNKFSNQKNSDSIRKNREIREREVRLIDATGENVGVVSIDEALNLAREAGLDLLEISPTTAPSVCKIMDYGKWSYEQQKKKTQAKKKQKTMDLKELKFSSHIEEHDYQVKLKNAKKFFDHGDKVKFSLRFKGREIANKQAAKELFTRIVEDLEGIAKIDQQPQMQGRNMLMILSPEN